MTTIRGLTNIPSLVTRCYSTQDELCGAICARIKCLNLRCTPTAAIQSGRRIEPHLSLLRWWMFRWEQRLVISKYHDIMRKWSRAWDIGVSYDQPMMRNYGLWIGHPAQPSWECYVLALPSPPSPIPRLFASHIRSHFARFRHPWGFCKHKDMIRYRFGPKSQDKSQIITGTVTTCAAIYSILWPTHQPFGIVESFWCPHWYLLEVHS